MIAFTLNLLAYADADIRKPSYCMQKESTLSFHVPCSIDGVLTLS